MDEIEIETDKYMYEKEYVDDLENGNLAYGENITYVAISPDGSIVATFNPYVSSISITKLTTNDKAKIRFDINKFKMPSNILGWSLAVSDIINTENDTCLVAISCVTDKDTNPKEIEKCGLRKLFKPFIKKQLSFWDSQLFLISLFILYFAIMTFYTINDQFGSSSLFYLVFIIIPISILFFYEYYCTRKILVSDIKQFRLSCTPGEGMIKLFKFSFKDDNVNIDDNNNHSIYNFGGVVTFTKYTENSLKNNATLICMDCVKIQKININLDKHISTSKEGTYLLPENLFKKLENCEDSRRNWNYLLKSRFQEYLMINTINHQNINIEIYDVNNLQLVNVFYKYHEEDCLILNDNEPGIFAISAGSRLFAYSYGDNIIALYLMESGLEVVSKKFDNIYKIKFLEFIEEDKKLFIIGEDKEHDVKFHIWIISGCLNDCFSISKDDIGLSVDNIFTLSKYDERYNALTKANGKVIFHNKNDEDQVRVVHKIIIERTTLGENDNVTDEHEYKSRDLEPWNNSTKAIRGRFLNNDRKLLLIIGQNSIQLWKSKSINFVDFDNFRNFENSNLVYILISDKIKPETKTKFLIDDDMTTVITHACKSLAYLYKHAKRINSKEIHRKFVSGIINIIKDFIKRYPDNWKLMEVQYPLMSYLIYSRSFTLIKYILFDEEGHTKDLHRPQNRYISYPYYNDLELYNDLESKDMYLESANDLALALKFCQDRDAVMLAYLLEYYSENSMSHIGWMLNVTKILPDLSKLSNHDYYGNYMDLLLYKPCFGEMKYNFPIKRFKALSVCQGTLNVYVPITDLISTNSPDIFLYDKMKEDIMPDIRMVPFINFTTHNTKIEGKSRKGVLHFLRKTLFPPSYKNLDDKKFSPLLQIKENVKSFLHIPAIEASINSRWYQAMAYWIRPLSLYAIFIILFSTSSQFYEKDNKSIIGIVIFYYIGIYLLITIDSSTDYAAYGYLLTITFFILWIEMLLWLRLFSAIAINIFIFGNILRKIIPFITFMIILIIGFGSSMYVLEDMKIIDFLSNSEEIDDKANKMLGMSIWETMLFIYYLNTASYEDFDALNNVPSKLFFLITHFILVLVLINMIIALMNDTFNKAREDGNLGLLKYRTELIDDFERLDIPFNKLQLYDFPYICYLQDPDLMKKWMKKSKELGNTKLYSWFKESSDKENITFDGVDITSWYELISSNENQDSISTPDHMTLWF
ncbi:hypothetical protein RhiirB3_432829 [Rhizophagus irregularis]|nr:hypothetical protein RhiirB3_432829 [Rhizophagus irregularis]